MTNGLYSSWIFNQNGQWSLIKYNMVYYPMHLPTTIVVTYEICVFFKGAQKQVFSSILKFENVNT